MKKDIVKLIFTEGYIKADGEYSYDILETREVNSKEYDQILKENKEFEVIMFNTDLGTTEITLFKNKDKKTKSITSVEVEVFNIEFDIYANGEIIYEGEESYTFDIDVDLIESGRVEEVIEDLLLEEIENSTSIDYNDYSPILAISNLEFEYEIKE